MNANAQRGEVNLVANGKTYLLALGINAICKMETEGPQNTEGKSFSQVLMGCRVGRVSDARLFFWCALQMHHADEVKTLEDAGAIIDAGIGPFGMVERVAALIDNLIVLNKAPDKDQADGKEGAPAGGDPPQPGTGERS